MRIFTIEFAGHLTVETLAEKMERVILALRVTREPVALLFDLLEMTSLDPPVRTRYIEWHARHKTRISKAAVVVARSLWPLVTATAQGTPRLETKTFVTVEDAHKWCAEDPPFKADGAKGTRERSG